MFGWDVSAETPGGQMSGWAPLGSFPRRSLGGTTGVIRRGALPRPQPSYRNGGRHSCGSGIWGRAP